MQELGIALALQIDFQARSLNTIDFSLIIACYKDADHLESNVKELVDYMNQCRFNFEIVMVEDCSPDGTALAVRKTAIYLEECQIPYQTIFHQQNLGRGRSVSDGIRVARGPIAGYIDIDLEHRMDALLSMINLVSQGADLVVGNRVVLNRVSRPLRALSSWVYKRLAHLVLPMSILDTEAGFKIFNRDRILPLLDLTQDQHWFWDTEIVHRALSSGLRCENFPIIFQEKPEKKSTVSLIPDSMAYLKAIYRYKKSIRILA